MTLEEFLTSQHGNAWLQEPGIAIYVRKVLNRFDVANINVMPELRGQGVFTAWLARAESVMPDEIEIIKIENVLNEVLIPFLLRVGYVPHDVYPECYVKRLT